MLLLISLFTVMFVSVSAWSPNPRTSHILHLHHRPKSTTHNHYYLKTQLYSTVSSSKTPEVQLSSAYDRNLPAALVGEAVRSALRSDRGICFDFTSDRYGDQDDDEISKSSNNSRLLSVVKMNGEGTKTFINAKFSQSIPNNNDERIGDDFGDQLSSKTKFIRRGCAFETAYLTSKGRMIDRLLVLQFPKVDETSGEMEEEDDAFLITSPGNSGSTLYNELSPLVFPMDKVTLTDGRSSPYQTKVITLACSSLKDAQTSFNNNVLKLLMKDDSYSKEFEFPTDGICHHYRVDMDSEGTKTDVYVLQHTFLSTEICHGYTLLFQQSALSNAPTLADEIWDNLTLEQNDKGPVGVGSLEYDTLRVEAGIPGYGSEMTGDGPKKKEQGTRSGGSDDDDDTYYAKSSPLELHLQNLIDTDKGCYQGQEGVASMLKNKRGCPRQLYQAIFYDSENDFNGDDDDDVGGYGLLSIDNKELLDFQKLKKQPGSISNDTRQPRSGDNIYVLGSNESIQVGRITSVAQPNGTGDAKTIALALAKRPDSILKSIKEQGLDLPRYWEDFEEENDWDESDSMKNVSNENGGSGIMQPPPLDPLHNLEIVIEGSYTVGRLVSVPSRRYASKSSGNSGTSSLLDYENRGEVVDAGAPAYVKYEFQEDMDEETTNDMDELLAKAEEEAAKAAAEAEAAAAEAKRKEEKMKLLKAKAEAAMAARRKKKESS